MTDLPAFYPNELIHEVQRRLAKNVKIHTLVLWTKHPASLFKEPLHSFLLALKKQHIQLYVQLTITGMGKEIVGYNTNNHPVILEPNVPDTREALQMLPMVISLTENPERIKLRVDPIVRIKDFKGNEYSNLSAFEPIVSHCASFGVTHYAFSFLEKEAYQKVNNRFIKRGLEIIAPTPEERDEMHTRIRKLEAEYKVSIHACCVEGFPESSCIDGSLLNRLNPQTPTISVNKPHTRALCGCTTSIDIGGWPPKKCYSGCLYCYATPHLTPSGN
jgi:hypothetical protein